MVKSSFKTLEEYIGNLEACALDDDLYVVKSPDCNFAYASDLIVKTFGYNNLSSLEGTSVYDIRSEVVELAPYLFSRDKRLIEQKTNSSILVNFNAKPLSGFIVHDGSPIISRDNKLIGSLIRFSKLEKPMLWSSLILNSYNPNTKKLDLILPHIDSVNNLQLSEREQKVLFLLSLNYTTSQIAEILSKVENKKITPNLIRNNINQQLYIKFEVNSVPDLIEKYSMLKQDKLIPQSFNKQFATSLRCEMQS